MSSKSSQANHQFRALSRRLYSEERRQPLTNLCMIFICPIFSTSLAGLLVLLLNVVPPGEGPYDLGVKYCSQINDIPYLEAPGFDTVPQTITLDPIVLYNETALDEGTKYINVNYFEVYSSFSSQGKSMCGYNLDETYPTSEPYFRFGNRSQQQDTIFQPEVGLPWFFFPVKSFPLPKGGKDGDGDRAGNEQNADGDFTGRDAKLPTGVPTYLPIVSNIEDIQTLPWFYVFADNGVDIGTKPFQAIRNLTDPLPPTGDETDKSGFFSGVPTRYFRVWDRFGNATGYLATNFFIDKSDESDPPSFVHAKLEEAIQRFDNLRPADLTSEELAERYDELFEDANILDRHPVFTALYFKEKKVDTMYLKYTIQAGRVLRLEPRVAAFGNSILSSVGVRILNAVVSLTNALLEEAGNTNRVGHSMRAMPETIFRNPNKFGFDIGSLVARYTLPIALMFTFANMIRVVVKEKEDKVLMMMRMHGMTTFTYYFSHYLRFMATQLFSSVVLILSGLAWQLDFFVDTDPAVYILLFILWASAMCLLAIFFSIFFSKARFAALFGGLVIALVSNLGNGGIFEFKRPPDAWYLFPPFAMSEAINQISFIAGTDFRAAMQMSDVTPESAVGTIFIYLFVESIVLALLIAYLDAVVPSEFGTTKPFYFVITEPYSYLRNLYLKSNNKVSENAKAKVSEDTLLKADNLAELEDDLVKKEREKVVKLTSEDGKTFPLIMRNIRKEFANGKIANRSMSLAIERNVVFGLLGPNGAGKSTLIHMMTGLYPPSSGTSFVAGFDILFQMDDVHRRIGVCPQHDVIWENLTCEEHLLFYTRLRGTPADKEEEEVLRVLKEVDLLPHRYRFSKHMSGGEKRRLSIAIAMSGGAELIFLDEPTTGLDPEVRRTIWNMIQNARAGRTVILTTHSMEEADILSDRIGIMALGVLRTIGTPPELKKKYGDGFKLTISFTKEADRKTGDDVMDKTSASEFIQTKVLPEGKWRKLEQGGVSGLAIYEFKDDTTGVVSRIMEKMVEHKDKLGVEDWGISQTSLEEVFLNIIKDSDADGTL